MSDEEALLRSLRSAAVALKKTSAERDALLQQQREAVAIVGIGCRFPGGAERPAAFWRLLHAGEDAIRSLDPRWALVGARPPDDVPVWAGLLNGVEDFDARFFGIAPREAASLDPQQRLLLELAWEALEDAGIVPAALEGGRTGVFVGACSTDYQHIVARLPAGQRDVYGVTGNMLSVAAGRLAYTLGLQGPCLTVDTACSSSLVAVHLACRSLRARESDLALAGGVNLILSPEAMAGLARTQALSPDGRCSTFDASANGFVRGEGCGVVALKRLSDAVRDGDRVWAVIRGSAVNQDGRSTGLTAPNVLSQQSLLEDALAAARVAPDAVGFVETHGTGTSLGDPIEVEALRAVLGAPRSDGSRCVLGACKTNIGHLEGAAGIAGLIKVALALHHEHIPANLNYRSPNPRLRLEGTALQVAAQASPWPRTSTARFGGVSAFGLSGTNAHAVLEEAPPVVAAAAAADRAAEILVVSAKSAAALDAAAAKLRAHVAAHAEQALGDLAFSLATTRTHHEHRLAFAVGSRDELLVALEAAAGGDTPAGGARGEVKAERGKLAFLFTGQGAQTLGMGRGLYQAWPVFRDMLDRCASLFALERPLLEVMWSEQQLLDDTAYTQPALFALEVSLCALWRSWGVVPEAVAGHSIGEIAAAQVAGVFSLEDACRLVAARGRLMQALPRGGAMVAIAAPEAAVAAALAPHAAQVSIAAVNGPSSVVISGETAPVEAIAASFASNGVRTKALVVSHAFHSPLMAPMLADFAVVAQSISYSKPSLPLVSNVSGALAGVEVTTPAYWVEHVRAAVRFADGVRALASFGARTFIEVGPKATLSGLVPEIVPELPTTLVPTLRAGRPESLSALQALGAVHASGATPDWQQVFPSGCRRVDLPTYSWQRERHWIDAAAASATQGGLVGRWPLSGRWLERPDGAVHHVIVAGTAAQPYLRHHFVHNHVVVPGAFYVSAILAAATERWPDEAIDVEDVEFLEALVLENADDVELHVIMTPSGRVADVEVATRRAASWVIHARARVGPAPKREGVALESLLATMTRSIAPAAMYASLAVNRVEWGPDWQWISDVRAGDGTAAIRISPPTARAEAPLHPVLLDSGFATTVAALPDDVAAGMPRLPFALRRVHWCRAPLGEVRCAARLRPISHAGAEAVTADLTLWDETGAVVALVEGFTLRRAPREVFLRALERTTVGDASFRVDWTAVAAPDGVPPMGRRLVVASGASSAAAELAAALASRGGSSLVDVAGLGAALKDAAVTDVVCLWDGAAGGGGAVALSRAALSVAQTVIGHEGVRLLWVTTGAELIESVSLAAAPVWGLGRVLMQEHPELRCTLIDANADDVSQIVLRELAAVDDENQIAWRDGQRHVARLVRAPASTEQGESLVPRDGTVLVTGGLGALGLHVASWLVERGVPHVLLTGRRGLQTPGAAEAVASLQERGARVTVAAVDVADRDALARVLAAIPAELPLRGVVHAAGVVDDGVFAEQTPERLAAVMAPKMAGAWHLHELTRAARLEMFVMFSSVSGTLGSAGQGPYAAANAFLDVLAVHRRAEGLAAQSLAWGPWSESGMAAALGAGHQARLARQGLGTLSPRQGITLLEQSLGRAEAHLVVVPLDLRVITKSFAEAVPPLWRALVQAPRAAPGARGAWARELAGLPLERRRAAVLDVVRAEVARALSLSSANAVPLDLPLMELGLDSLTAVEIRNALGQRASVTLPATLAFDYPTPPAIADYLLEQVLKLSEPSPVIAPAVPPALGVAVGSDEPIAIIGIGCRYPGGAVDPQSFWRVLENGVDAVTEVPQERWNIDEWYDPDPDASGKMMSRWGGFLGRLDEFEPTFFGISPREARSIDPQQRLLLETTWEALEHAGVPPEKLMGSNTGVYMGLCGTEYQVRAIADVEAIDAYSLLGTLHCAIVGRLSYWLGLKGPNMPIDTACSSSLVAIHVACQALRAGECSMALAGGVNVMISPEWTVYFSRLHAMSPTGRCRAFSADADGYVRGEGAGVVVLKRLSDAQRDGDTVLAVIRGSAVNQDGRSNGMTAPNGPSQQAVIRTALARADVLPHEIDYVECHGTGTPLGDPIEVQALGAVLAEGRAADRPVLLGSVKTNFGHTEGAAGVAGLIKAVLALHHARIPKVLHFTEPNRFVAWGDLPVRVAAEALAWPQHGRPRRAGVSSFGFSGTNAHVVLEQAPVVAAAAAAEPRAAELMVLSGKSLAAVNAAALKLQAHVTAHPEQSLGDVAFSLATTRTHHEHRLALAVGSRQELLVALEGAARGETPAGGARGEAKPERGKLAFLFTGQGAQTLGMGRGLYQAWPVFRETLDRCARLFALERPLLEVMWSEQQLLDDTAYTQPALFALEVSLCALWRSWGVLPDAVAGHSIGEIAAAHVAGVFSLEDACRLVAARGRLMQALPRGGAMVAIAAAEAEVAVALAPHAAQVSIAAVNGPTSVVISGDAASVAAIASTFASKGVRTKALVVSHAFHSPLMAPMLADFAAVAQSISYSKPSLPLVSNVSGALAAGEVTTPAYWVEHVRAAVRFADGVRVLAAFGANTFIEIGPKATLSGLVPEILPELASTLVPTLRAGRAESQSALEALGAVHALGGTPDWSQVLASGCRRVELPTTAWQRERHWIDPATARAGESTGHPLLGARIPAAGADAVFENVIELVAHPWLADHRVAGRVVLPGAAVAELLRAAGELRLESPAQVESLALVAPLVLPESGGCRVQVIVASSPDGVSKASLYSQPSPSPPSAVWTLHATGTVAVADEPATRADLAVLRRRSSSPVDVDDVYAAFSAVGLSYGPSFRGLVKLWRSDGGESLGEVSLRSLVVDGYGVHPALLDAAFHASAALQRNGDDGPFLPFELERFRVHRVGASAVVAHVRRLESSSASVLSMDVALLDEAGELVAEAKGLRAKRADAGALRRLQGAALPDALYRLEWSDAQLAMVQPSATASIAVIGSPTSSAAQAMAARFGVAVVDTAAPLPIADHIVCLWEPRDAIEGAIEGLRVVQQLAAAGNARLWWVTVGAVAAQAGESPCVEASSLWGLGRVVMQEHPELRCTLVDIDDAATAADVVLCELDAADGEAQIAWRSGTRRVARLTRAPAVDLAEPRAPSDGTVLVTGGLGALGLHVARWLIGRGVPHLVLTGRRGMLTPGAPEAVQALTALGGRVTVAAVDVADREGLASVLEAIPADLPLRGVVHAAGILDDGVLTGQSAQRMAAVMSPKVSGALHLDELTRHLDLDLFVLFSSLAGAIGTAGQGPYAAANAALDAIAIRRRAAGRRAHSLAWGPWSEGGMASSLATVQRSRVARMGIASLSSAEGVALLQEALGRGDAYLAIAPLDLRAVARSFGDDVPSLWRSLIRARRAAPASGAWAQELSALSAEQRESAVRDVVCKEVARALSLSSASAVRLHQPLQELGFDSLMAVELRNALAQRVGIALPATMAFDHPTPAGMASYLLRDVLALAAEPVVAAHVTASEPDEPIAIIGIGCRYPGGIVDRQTFWSLLADGVDAISEVPAERWDVDALYDPDPDAAGKMTTRSGGFVRDVDRFDAAFFGISPREAARLDPQQRLLLETSVEALECAGVPPDRVMASNTGVFVGLMYHDYAALSGGLEGLDGYVGTGSAGSIASGRISYLLGLQGPSMTVDTACSSSLVTLHLACQALRSGECALALAGGVALMLSPATHVEFSRLRGLSSDGRCKSFSAAADGVGWSEGCGMLLLKRLSSAQHDGDRVLAVIRGSAVNQDGRSNGLTAPNGPSQQAVIAAALRQASLAPSQIDYVECHGTGTSLGDPIEVQALGAALAEGRDRPVVIGSIKSNLGHTQAAAGVAGVIKAVLSLEHECIPKNLHFAEPSPQIDWARLPVAVAREAQPWRRGERPRYAGVSSFGISGTNAHVVLQEAPAVHEQPHRSARAAELIVVSGRSAAALDATAAKLSAHVAAHPEQSLGDVAFSLATTRTHHEHRLALAVSTREELLVALEAAARGEIPAAGARGDVNVDRGRVAFLFTGQGAQVVGMGRGLYEAWPAFRDTLDRCATLFALERPLFEVMWSGQQLLDETAYTQPALFALEVSLCALWRSWGVVPDVVAGHSIGEIAAAQVAGVFSLEDACRLVAARGRLMQALPRGGAMVAIAAAEAEVAVALAPHAARVSIAAVNGPTSVVISGDTAQVEAVASAFASKGVRTKALVVSHAFHSPLMAPMLADFAAVASSITYGKPSIPLVSNVSGALAGVEVTTPAYWVEHVRAAVRFADGVRALAAFGARTFIEVGPKATLSGLVPEIVPGLEVTLVPTLRAGRPESQSALLALGAFHASGGTPRWPDVFPSGGHRVPLPSYPWQRQRYWVEPAPVPLAAKHAELLPDAALTALAGDASLSPQARAALPELIEALSRARADEERRARVAPWFAQLSWRRAAEAASPARAEGRWLIVADDADGLSLAAALRSAGGSCDVVGSVAALGAHLATGEPARGVIVVSPRDGDDECSVLALLQLAIEHARPTGPRCWLVTRSAVRAHDDDGPVRPGQSVLWGVGRVLALEHPALWGGLIDLAPGDIAADTAARVAQAIVGAGGEDQCALRAGQRFVPRIVARPPDVGARLGFLVAGSALVTGGLGGLGLHVARWLARNGARQLVLTARRGMDSPGAAEAVAVLRALGSSVRVIAADVADHAAMASALAGLEAPLTAVFHVAGIVDATPLVGLTADRLRQVLAAKRQGTENLAALTSGASLQAFVCFSSIAATWGSAGQAAYAAANAYLDGWAVRARQAGLPATSVAWGPWSGDGVATEDARAFLRRRGLRAMDPSAALDALALALTSGPPNIIVADVGWPQFRESFEAFGPRAFLSEMSTAATVVDSGGNPLADALAALPAAAQLERLKGWLQEQGASLIGHAAPASIDRQAGFFALGLDSLMAVELRRRVQKALGIVVSATITFDHPNIDALAQHLAQVGGWGIKPEAVAPRAAARDLTDMDDEEVLAALDQELALAEDGR